MDIMKNYEHRANWYALLLCAIKRMSADDAFQVMGLTL